MVVTILSAVATAQWQCILGRMNEGGIEAKEKCLKFGRKRSTSRKQISELKTSSIGITARAKQMNMAKQRSTRSLKRRNSVHSLTLYRIDMSRNMHRFYHLDIQPDLFGNCCLIREWGRMRRPDQVRSIPYSTRDEAHYAFHEQRETKERRGYAA